MLKLVLIVTWKASQSMEELTDLAREDNYDKLTPCLSASPVCQSSSVGLWGPFLLLYFSFTFSSSSYPVVSLTTLRFCFVSYLRF